MSDTPRIYGKGVIIELEYLTPVPFSTAELRALSLAEPFRIVSNVDILIERDEDTIMTAGGYSFILILAGQEIFFKPYQNEKVEITWIAPYVVQEKTKDPWEFAPDFVAYVSICEAHT